MTWPIAALARSTVIALSFCSLAGLSSVTAESAEPIRIGAFLDVTGPAAFLGDAELKTMKLYVERLNQEGGVLGRPIALVAYDSRAQADKVVSFVKRLIHDDQVDLIVGGSTTGTTMAAVPLVEQEGIPFLSLAGADVIVDPIRRWVFKIPHSDSLAIGRIYEDMAARGIKRIGLLSGAGGFDQSCRANALRMAAGYGIEILADEQHGRGDTDVTPQLTRIKGIEGLAGFLYCGFGAPTSIVAKNFRQLGLTVPHYHTHGSASEKFIEGADGAAEGIRLPAAAVLAAVQLPDNHPQKAVALAFKQTYEAAFQEPISTFAGHAYDGLMIAVQAITRAGSTDRAKVRDEIERTTRYIGADGIYTMSASDHVGLDRDSFVLVEVRNGTWHLVGPQS